jgi:hypothetical protein
VEDEKDDFGSFLRWPFRLLWNNRKYRQARRHVRDRRGRGRENVCVRCDHIGNSNHSEKKL